MRRASLPLFIERGTRTLQEQIYRGIRQSILDGLVSADQRLPSTRSLAADLGVSRTTALLALEQLRAEGYLIARPGSGTFIAPRLPEHRRMPVSRPRKPIARPPFSRRGQLLSRMQAPDRRGQRAAAGIPARYAGARSVSLAACGRRSRVNACETAPPHTSTTRRSPACARCAKPSPSRCRHAARAATPTRCRWSQARSAAWT